MSDEKMLTKEIAEKHLANEDNSWMSEFTTIEDEAAAILARYPWGSLYLISIVNLSAIAATHLSNHFNEEYSDLTLTGLEYLSDEVAEALAGYQGYLDLGSPRMSPTAAKSLLKCSGLRNISEMFPEIHDVLKHHESFHLTLEKLEQDIRNEEKWGSEEVDPDSYFKIDADAVVKLLEYFAEQRGPLGDLGFARLEHLPDAAAESLSKHKGDLGLRGLTSLSDTAAESLSKYEDKLTLNGLTELSDAAARGLANKKPKFESWEIELDNLPKSAAKILRDAGHG